MTKTAVPEPMERGIALTVGGRFVFDSAAPDARDVAVAALDLATDPGASLAPSLAYVRDLARRFIAAACKTADLDAAVSAQLPVPTDLDAWCEAAPPFAGGEVLTTTALATFWGQLEVAWKRAWSASGETLEAFLRQRGGEWHLLGRIFFHLAEKKGDAERPFAFLATYTANVSEKERVKHVPLGRALTEYAGARNKAALLALLTPVGFLGPNDARRRGAHLGRPRRVAPRGGRPRPRQRQVGRDR